MMMMMMPPKQAKPISVTVAAMAARRRDYFAVLIMVLVVITVEYLRYTRWHVESAACGSKRQPHPQQSIITLSDDGGGGSSDGLRLAASTSATTTAAATSIPAISLSDESMQQHAWSKSPIVVERLRLVYCSIPKNACTMMKRVVLNVERSSEWDTMEDIGYRVHDPTANNLRYLRDFPLERANQMLRDPQWTRVVVVRDPIQRFASAFLDKCDMRRFNATTGAPFVHPNCPVSDLYLSKDPSAVLGALEAAAARDGGFAAVDLHFQPQSHFCDLKRFLPVYSIAGVDRAFSAMSALFKQLPVPETDRQAALQALRAVNGNPSLSPHRTRSQELAAIWTEEAKQCKVSHHPSCDRSMAARIRSLYKDDYAAFCEQQQGDCEALF